MGHSLDAIDVDPRHGGLESMTALQAEGLWPKPFCEASTPSGGIHVLVPPLGVRSATNVWPGIDIRAGVDGRGNGFVFIYPTTRASRTTGELVQYRWLIPPATSLRGAASPEVFAAAVRDRLRSPPSRPVRAQGTAKDAPTQSRLNAAVPCLQMLGAEERAMVALRSAVGRRHDSFRDALQWIAGLSSSGHSGSDEVLARLKEPFVDAVGPYRPRGAQEAREEWRGLVDGAWPNVAARRLDRDAICGCRLDEVRRAMADKSLFSPGKAGQGERRLLRFLLHEAERQGASVVRKVDQRSIASAISSNQSDVSRGLARLEDLGWTRTLVPVDPLEAHPVRLLFGRSLTTTASSSLHAVGKGEDSFELNMYHRPHRLFGYRRSGGLSPGAEEALAGLAEMPVDEVGVESEVGVRCREGSSLTPGLVRPWSGHRQIPQPMPDGRGRTLPELAETLQLPPSSVRRHLDELRGARLVFSKGRGSRPALWWRYRFDPDVVADELGVEDRLLHQQMRHAEQRATNLEKLRTAEFRDRSELFFAADQGDVNPATGEVTKS